MKSERERSEREKREKVKQTNKQKNWVPYLDVFSEEFLLSL